VEKKKNKTDPLKNLGIGTRHFSKNRRTGQHWKQAPRWLRLGQTLLFGCTPGGGGLDGPYYYTLHGNPPAMQQPWGWG